MSPLFILGADDPEMQAIEGLLRANGISIDFARSGGDRVTDANAYDAELPTTAQATLRQPHGAVYLVECVGELPHGCTRIGHHREGEPGFGAPPDSYWEASSLGQTANAITERLHHGVLLGVYAQLIAAADHCLLAAYRGECYGVDPERLLKWRVLTYAQAVKRPPKEVWKEIEAARMAVLAAQRVTLAPGVFAVDMRESTMPGVAEAAAREGLCALTAKTSDDGKTIVACVAGSPEHLRAFSEHWAAQSLTRLSVNPARQFASGYLKAA